IPVPVGMLATTADIEPPTSLEAPWMVKAQIPAGGRGKAGGIQPADTIVELRQRLGELLWKTIKGPKDHACPIDQCAEGMEHYLSVSLDPCQARLRMLLSSEGGVDIEAHAERGALRSADVAFNEREAIAAASRLADSIAGPTHGTIVRAAEQLI